MAETPAKKKRTGLIVAGIVVALLIALIVWLYGPRILDSLSGEATLPPEAAAEPGGVLYQTSFDNPEDFGDWELFDDSVITAKEGESQLIVSVNAVSDTGTFSGLNMSFTNFKLDVLAQKLEGPDDNGIMVVFGMTDTANYKRFEISSDGYYSLNAIHEGESTVISDWNITPAIQTGGAPNTISISAVNGVYSFAVNGQLLPLCISSDPGAQALWDPFAETPACIGGEITETWVTTDSAPGRIGLGAQGYTGFDGEATTMATAVIGFDSVQITAPLP